MHHGGVGTCGQGLAAGVPQLVMAMSHDQPDNAARLERLGVGLAIKPKHFRGPEVAKQLRRLLEQPEMALRCKALATRIDARAALEATCDELESLAVVPNGRLKAQAA